MTCLIYDTQPIDFHNTALSYQFLKDRKLKLARTKIFGQTDRQSFLYTPKIFVCWGYYNYQLILLLRDIVIKP